MSSLINKTKGMTRDSTVVSYLQSPNGGKKSQQGKRANSRIFLSGHIEMDREHFGIFGDGKLRFKITVD